MHLYLINTYRILAGYERESITAKLMRYDWITYFFIFMYTSDSAR